MILEHRVSGAAVGAIACGVQTRPTASSSISSILMEPDPHETIVPMPLPTAAPMPSASPVPALSVQTSYAYVSTNVLLAKCAGCHNVNFMASPGVLFTSYAETIKNVTPGKPEQSRVFRAMTVLGPPPAGNGLLSVQEYQSLYGWIAEGAQNN